MCYISWVNVPCIGVVIYVIMLGECIGVVACVINRCDSYIGVVTGVM